MFRTRKSGAKRRIVVVTPDAGLGNVVKNAIAAPSGFETEIVDNALSLGAERLQLPPNGVLIVHLAQPLANELQALERVTQRAGAAATPIIVISDHLDEAAIRALLRLGVVDWLPVQSAANEINAAFRRAMAKAEPDQQAQSGPGALAFMPSVGGAGATTLAIAALEIRGRGGPAAREACCIVDLNFQNGTLADYLDVERRLDLSEIIDTPDRLDPQLLDVSLSRHKSGFAVLAAQPVLSIEERVDSRMIARLLDLAAPKFRTLVIDMPPVWKTWCENVVRGVDKFFIVSDMSVAGLRHAHTLAELVSEKCGVDLSRSIIVNKFKSFGGGGVKKQDAQDVLGPYLAGFISDDSKVVRAAQDEGVLPSQLKSRNTLTADLRKILDAKP
mgnify:FL=1